MMDLRMIPAAPLAAALLLAGCVSDLDHSTVAVAALGPGSPRTISGETLRECVADSRVRVPTGDTGIFDTAYSGQFAKSVFYQGGGVDVSSLRTYSVPFVATNIFGTKKDRSLACLYDFRDGKLVYMSHLNVDSEGKVDLEDVQRAGKATYLKLKDAGRAQRVTLKAAG